MPGDGTTRPPDLIGVALGSLAAGASAGAAAVAAGLATLPRGVEPVLVLLPLVGIVTAATVAWLLAGPIADWWRRGVTAGLAVVGALMLAALTAPLDMAGGWTALVAYAAALAGAAFGTGRYAWRSRTVAR